LNISNIVLRNDVVSPYLIRWMMRISIRKDRAAREIIATERRDHGLLDTNNKEVEAARSLTCLKNEVLVGYSIA